MKFIIKLLPLLFCFVTLSFASAQKNNLGFKTGLAFGTFGNVDEEEIAGELEGELGNILGVQFGALYEIRISNKFSIQPEVNFRPKGFKFTGTEEIDGFDFKVKTKFVVNYLDVPILAKYNFGDPKEILIYITAGPSFAYAMNAHQVARLTGLGQTNKERQAADLDELAYNRYEASVSLGTGFEAPMDYGSLFFDARYLLGLTNLNKEGGRENANYNRGFGFTMGYKVSLDQIED